MNENEQIDERLQASAEYQRRKKYVYRIAEAVSYKGKDDHEDVWSILYSFQKEIERDFLSKGYRKVERGEWVEAVHDWDFGDYTDYRCSICGTREQNKRPFCPECGADMRGELYAEIH